MPFFMIKKLPMIHVPMTGGAIVPVTLVVTSMYSSLVRLLTGYKNIVTVHRSDGSGTTKGFTNSLSSSNGRCWW